MKSNEFEQQLTDLRPALFRFTKRFVRSNEESKDLVQDTLLKALNHRGNFRENKNLVGWLYVIMRNTFVNEYRKNAPIRNRVLGDSIFTWIEDDSLRKADGPLYIDEVWAAINSINQELGKTFKMHLSGFKYEEIAEQLKVPMGTVKSRIFLARQEIRNQLPGYC